MTRELVLKYFEQNKGIFTSGEQLAEKIGVSRTAIWKAINTLREEGYDIEAAPKKGYCLNENSDILSLIKIKQNLKHEEVFSFQLYKTVDSTNKKAKRLALEEGREWTVVASERQEEGKGQKKKVFSSPERKGIYISVLFTPQKVIKDLQVFSRLGASCMQEAILKVTGVKTSFESPSIVYEGKKLGGILTEASLEVESHYVDSVIIGVGLNIYGQKSDFAHKEDDIHTSLSEITGKYCNRSELIAAWINALYDKYESFF